MVRGSPIRKSSDQRSVDSSPRLIAASYVLHRLLVPRHPPCALNNLATQTPTPTHHTQQGPTPTPEEVTTRPSTCRWISAGIQIHTYKLARCSRPLCSSQRTESDPTSPTASPGTTPQSTPGGTTSMRPSEKKHPTPYRAGPFPQDPTACLQPPHRTRSRSRPRRDVLGTRHSRRPNWSVFHPRAPPPT